jgi:hypothetical protein
MTSALSVPISAQVEEFLQSVNPKRGRIILGFDATASREETWDRAMHLQAQMFETVATTGGLDVQLVYYRGYGECVASRWKSDAKSLATIMSGVTCSAGHTQIRKVLAHTRKEHSREKVAALVVVSDACEETPYDPYAEARELGVPTFMFQEGSDEYVAEIYAEIAKLTKGAHCKFDNSSAQRLADLLKAVAAFASGGVKALANQNSEAARLLLTQVKKDNHS